MTRRLSQLVDSWTYYTLRQERRGVTRRLVIGTLVLFASVLVAGLLLDAHGVVGEIASVYVSAVAGAGCVSYLRTRQAYQHGYMDGRASMFASFFEANRRAMSVDDWVRVELSRDMGNL